MEHHVIHLWQNPPNISDKMAWCVFLQDRETDYYLREIKGFSIANWPAVLQRVQSGKWDKSFLENAVHLTKISKPELDKRLELLSQINIPLRVNHPSGYDGVDYGLELFNTLKGYKLSWWEQGPKEWKPLIDWYHETLAFFAHSLNSPSSPLDNNY